MYIGGESMEKQEFAFAFIQKHSPEWATLAKEFEKLLFTDIDAALIKARKLTEALLKDVYIKEEIDILVYSNHAEKLMILKNLGVLDDELFKSFDRIRRIGNIAAHEHQAIPFSDGLKIHSNLYTILKWYMESFFSFDIQIPEYQDPKPENLDDKVKKLFQEYLPGYLKNVTPLQEETTVAVGTIDTDTMVSDVASSCMARVYRSS